MFKWLSGLLEKLRAFGQGPDFHAIRMDKHPAQEDMKNGLIYLVGSGGYTKWAYLKCPCPRKDVLRLSLMERRAPSWQVVVDPRGRPTVSPSIRQLDGCFSHFWIRSGRVIWCADSGTPPRYLSTGVQPAVSAVEEHFSK